jgi:thioredoxin reductase
MIILKINIQIELIKKIRDHFDVIIIGAGPVELTCGIEAKKRNKKYPILEKGNLVNSLFHP